MMSSAGDRGNKESDGQPTPSSGGEPPARPAKPPSGARAAAGGPPKAARPSSAGARSATAAGSTAGKLAKELGGTTPIPKGTNLAFGFSPSLENFAESQNAVSVFKAWEKSFLRINVGMFRELQQTFGAIVDTFLKNGGRIKFDLTGLQQGIEGATTWELRKILGSKLWEAGTDFFRDGKQLTGAALKEALKPWR